MRHEELNLGTEVEERSGGSNVDITILTQSDMQE